MYETIQLKVTFVMPAFLGGESQAAEWRAPPFKALLRQWWRVAVARSHGYDHEAVREAEGPLFGHAWLKNGNKVWAMRGRCTVSLDSWKRGTLRQWRDEKMPGVFHPEVGRDNGMTVNAALYLGYGPMLHTREKGVHLKAPPAIAAGESATLTVRVPSATADDVKRALQLMHLFGAAGGRSRNGWGSFSLEATGGDLALPAKVEDAGELVRSVADDADACLARPWPGAIGTVDGRPLIWATAPRRDWKQVLGDLGKAKVAFRTAFSLDRVPRGDFGDRHFLAYPVTNHRVNGKAWGGQGRLANQVRFKVVKEDGQYRGIVVHLPCALPGDKRKQAGPAASAERERDVWQRVHRVLDEKLTRVFPAA